MRRLGAIFVAVCIVLIAGSAGVVLYLWFALGGTESLLGALAVLTVLVLFNATSSRVHDQGEVAGQIADLSRGTADLARQVGDLGRRVAAMETLANAAVDKTLAATRPITAELDELAGLIRQLAETVAAHEAVLKGPVPVAVARAEGPAAAPAGERGREATATLVREAIEAGRIDLYLQPIVTLPQRKVRYYEAMARLRTADGELMLPGEFLPCAEAGGLMPKLDTVILFRCVQVLRRLIAKNRDIGLFCNISATTLGDPAVFPQLIEFLDANRTLASALLLELRQSAYRSLGPFETEAMAALWDRGFRFSMDHVDDLRIEPRDLSERGFRFIKIPAALLLDRVETASDIHPADFAGLLGRFGVELVAVKIESESAVVDLLDYDIKFGQGFLFSPPRPVRPEVMQGITERQELAVREVAEAAEAPEPPRPAAAAPLAEARPVAGHRSTSALAQIARGLVARG